MRRLIHLRGSLGVLWLFDQERVAYQETSLQFAYRMSEPLRRTIENDSIDHPLIDHDRSSRTGGFQSWISAPA